MENNGPWIARNQVFASRGSQLLWHVLSLVFCQNDRKKIEPVRQTKLGPAKSERSYASGSGKVQLSWVPGNVLFLKTILRILVLQSLARVIE